MNKRVSRWIYIVCMSICVHMYVDMCIWYACLCICIFPWMSFEFRELERNFLRLFTYDDLTSLYWLLNIFIPRDKFCAKLNQKKIFKWRDSCYESFTVSLFETIIILNNIRLKPRKNSCMFKWCLKILGIKLIQIIVEFNSKKAILAIKQIVIHF